DDEEAIVDVLQQTLVHLGYRVEGESSSKKVLEIFRSNPARFDLVITDMTMPGLTGDKLARELIDIRPDIPIILCTGFSEKVTNEEALSIGIRELLLKPLDTADLADKVRKVLNLR
ncbi:MAG: response regulator, partial [Desulfobulbaceae bacterium]|nr:response regulator [Desulfobulbaceae bacterium]